MSLEQSRMKVRPNTFIKTSGSSSPFSKPHLPHSSEQIKNHLITFNTGCWHHLAVYYGPPESKYSLMYTISPPNLLLFPRHSSNLHNYLTHPWPLLLCKSMNSEGWSHRAVVKLTGKREFLCFSSSLVFHLSKPCVRLGKETRGMGTERMEKQNEK